MKGHRVLERSRLQHGRDTHQCVQSQRHRHGEQLCDEVLSAIRSQGPIDGADGGKAAMDERGGYDARGEERGSGDERADVFGATELR